jgi:glycosyltransferase involved in cell wall biosynthesis
MIIDPVTLHPEARIAEAIEQRRHGILVAPGDAAALCASLIEVLDDETLRREIGKGARQRQIDSFSVTTMAAGVAAVYDRLLGAG